MERQKKKISVLLPDMRGGGVERMRLILSQEWRRRGYEVELVLLQKHGELLPLVPQDMNVIDFGVTRLRSSFWPLTRYLRRAKPDILLVAMWPLTSIGVMAWLLAGRPGKVFVSDHTQLSISAVRELGVPVLVLRLLMGMTYPLAHGVIAVSDGVRRDMCALGRLKPSLIRVINNPAAAAAPAARADAPGAARIDGRRRRVLGVGSLKAQKDFPTLIQAFARVAADVDAELIILGEGPLRPHLEGLVRKLDLTERVSMPGFVSDPTEWFLASDLFVLSSRWEGFGNVIVEALNCGTPVVSTDCQSGPAEILEDGRFGKLVPVGDVESMASAIREALEQGHDPDRLKRRAQDFSPQRIADNYLTYFGEPVQ